MENESLENNLFNLTSQLALLPSQELTEMSLKSHQSTSSEMNNQVAEILKHPVFEKYPIAKNLLFRDELAAETDPNQKAGFFKLFRDIFIKRLERSSCLSTCTSRSLPS